MVFFSLIDVHHFPHRSTCGHHAGVDHPHLREDSGHPELSLSPFPQLAVLDLPGTFLLPLSAARRAGENLPISARVRTDRRAHEFGFHLLSEVRCGDSPDVLPSAEEVPIQGGLCGDRVALLFVLRLRMEVFDPEFRQSLS